MVIYTFHCGLDDFAGEIRFMALGVKILEKNAVAHEQGQMSMPELGWLTAHGAQPAAAVRHLDSRQFVRRKAVVKADEAFIPMGFYCTKRLLVVHIEIDNLVGRGLVAVIASLAVEKGHLAQQKLVGVACTESVVGILRAERLQARLRRSLGKVVKFVVGGGQMAGENRPGAMPEKMGISPI